MLKWLVVLAVIWAAWKWLGRPRRPAPVQTSSRAEREAQWLLGVTSDADDQAIRDAHRRRVAEAHPDRGGSAELTRELNAARDLLLAARR